ncbi:hypothetical protein ERJ75_000865000 [Trypanosoma vivax]|nr:hypothetical protein ERJ75_000865000 [Trypanosoma vivax]
MKSIMSAFLLSVIVSWSAYVALAEGQDGGKGEKPWQCQWLDTSTRAHHWIILVRRIYLEHSRELYEEYKAYVANMTNSEVLRNYKSVREKRQIADNAFDEARASGEEIKKAMHTVFTGINSLTDRFRKRQDVGMCNHSWWPAVESNHNYIERLENLDTEVQLLAQLTAAHAPGFDERYTPKIRQRIHVMKMEEEFFRLKEKAMKSFKSAIEAQKVAKRLERVIVDRMALGCEIERKLSVVKEIFLGLKHVAADVISREGLLIKRLESLKKEYQRASWTANIPSMNGIDDLVESAGREAEVAYTEILGIIQGKDSATFREELGQNGEFKMGGEKCMDDIREEQALLRESARQGLYNFHSFVHWRPVVESLWNKVKNVDNIVGPNCRKWKDVKCKKLAKRIRRAVEKADARRVNVEDKLTSAIKALSDVEDALWHAEVNAKAAAEANAGSSERGANRGDGNVEDDDRLDEPDSYESTKTEY